MKLSRGLNMNTTDEFIKAVQSIVPIIEPKIEYRFYYDDAGNITTCSQVNHQEYGNYLVVTEHEYKEYFQYCVVKGKLKKIDIGGGHRVQLKRSSQGYRVVNNHAGIILASNEEYHNMEYYDNN